MKLIIYHEIIVFGKDKILSKDIVQKF